jgi:lactose/L-arabinose transport system substrate-binding protein
LIKGGKKMIKKLLALLLCVTVIISTATACGTSKSSDDASTEGTSDTTETADTSDSSDKEETLTVWCWDENFNIPIMETAAEYYKKAGHENFKINVVNVEENDVETKSITAFTSGVSDGMPDILLMGDYSAQNFLTNYAGKYADLTDSIDFSQFAQNKVADYTVDGHVYGVPFDSGSAGMYYRKDLFEQAGYTADDLKNITWTQLVEIGKKVKEATGKYVFVFTPYKGTHYMQMALQSCGQWFYKEDGSANFANNQVIRYMADILKQMYKADLIYPVDYWSAEGVGAVQNGDVAAHLSAVWYIPTLTSVPDASGKWGYTNLPTVEGVDGATQYSNIGGSSWVVLEDSKNKDLAIDFLKTVYAGNDEFYLRS